MADFGNAGKRTARQQLGSVQVNRTAGEYLSYKLTVEGATPIFSFACEHRSLRSEKDFPGHPMREYEWLWGKDDADSDADDDVYVVGMSFLTATKYTLRVEHRRDDDSVIKLLKDIDYESQDPNDNFKETLRVFSS